MQELSTLKLSALESYLSSSCFSQQMGQVLSVTPAWTRQRLRTGSPNSIRRKHETILKECLTWLLKIIQLCLTRTQLLYQQHKVFPGNSPQAKWSTFGKTSLSWGKLPATLSSNYIAKTTRPSPQPSKQLSPTLEPLIRKHLAKRNNPIHLPRLSDETNR